MCTKVMLLENSDKWHLLIKAEIYLPRHYEQFSDHP